MMSDECIIKKEEYRSAIDKIKLAMTQLEPDGQLCAICGDIDHQAWECHHNPLVLAKRVEHAEGRWRCYHCDEVFDDPEEARKHFGNISFARSHCIIKKCLCLDCGCNSTECKRASYLKSNK